MKVSKRLPCIRAVCDLWLANLLDMRQKIAILQHTVRQFMNFHMRGGLDC